MKNNKKKGIVGDDNLKNIDLSEIDFNLSSYTLSKWKLGKEGYPVLDWQE